MFAALVFAAVGSLSAPIASHHVMRLDGDRIVCTGATTGEIEEFDLRRRERRIRRYDHSYYLDTYRERQISIDFDSEFPDEAKDAVQAAANIWESHLLIDIPIVIEVTYEEFEGEDAPLAQARTPSYCRRYCVAASLFNQTEGRDRSPGEPEMVVEIGDRSDWYFGLDGNPPEGKIDLVEIVLHEIGHGLGFIGGLDLPEDFDEENPTAEYYEDEGRRYLFSWFLWTREHGWLYDREDVANPSGELYQAATGHKLFWGHEDWNSSRGMPLRGVRANGGPIMMWAPSGEFAGTGSHMDKDAYPHGTRDSLMTPSASRGSALHDPGPVVLGMLYDLGWELKERAVDPLDVLRCLESR